MTDQEKLPGLSIKTNATTQDGTKSSDLRRGSDLTLKLEDNPELRIALTDTSSVVVYQLMVQAIDVEREPMAISES